MLALEFLVVIGGVLFIKNDALSLKNRLEIVVFNAFSIQMVHGVQILNGFEKMAAI